MNRQTNNIIRALLQGLTGAGLFRRLSYPGAPRYAVDPRPISQIAISTPGLQNLKYRAQDKRAEEYRYPRELREREHIEKATHRPG
jgi:hypothetical protein